jgi:purine-binding chemotaxis protein CheW
MNDVAGQRGESELTLIFRLNGEAFALTVDCVQEILDPIPTTVVPGAPAFAPALVNVRGAVLPLVDPRRRLGMPIRRHAAANDAVSDDQEERFIVIETSVAEEPVRLAIMADGVEEVIETPLDTLEALPELGARWPARFVRGVAKRRDGVVILLDANMLFAPDTTEDSNF